MPSTRPLSVSEVVCAEYQKPSARRPSSERGLDRLSHLPDGPIENRADWRSQHVRTPLLLAAFVPLGGAKAGPPVMKGASPVTLRLPDGTMSELLARLVCQPIKVIPVAPRKGIGHVGAEALNHGGAHFVAPDDAGSIILNNRALVDNLAS